MKKLQSVATGAAVTVIIVALGLAILEGFSSNMTAASAAANAVDDGVTQLATLVTWVGTAILIGVAVFLLAQVKKAF